MDKSTTPKEYQDQFESCVRNYIETQFGTREEYIDDELYRLDREIQQLESGLGPESMDSGLYQRAEKFGLIRYINANRRKFEFLKEISMNESNQNSKKTNEETLGRFNGFLKMNPTRAVELIRAMKEAGYINGNLKDAYTLLGLLIGKKFDGINVSDKIKQRKNGDSKVLTEPGMGWEEFLNPSEDLF